MQANPRGTCSDSIIVTNQITKLIILVSDCQQDLINRTVTLEHCFVHGGNETS